MNAETPYSQRQSEKALAEQRAAYHALLQTLGTATAEEIAAALDARDVAEPEEGLTPELVAAIQQRIWKN